MEKIIRLLLTNALSEFNAWSHSSAMMSARLSEIDGEEYFEAEGRRMQARVMLEDIARVLAVEVKYKGKKDSTMCEGEKVPVYWREAYIDWGEVCSNG